MTAIINSNPLKNNNCRENIYLVSLDLIKLVNLLSYLIIRAKMRKKYIKPKNISKKNPYPVKYTRKQ